jgi:hypothetical protein
MRTLSSSHRGRYFICNKTFTQICRTNKESKSQDTEEPSSSGNSADRINDSGILPIPSNGNGNSKSFARPSSEKKQSTRLDSFREEKVIQIEES